jgi:uncharacterized membrane protein YbhN (UPF0104 family)
MWKVIIGRALTIFLLALMFIKSLDLNDWLHSDWLQMLLDNIKWLFLGLLLYLFVFNKWGIVGKAIKRITG